MDNHTYKILKLYITNLETNKMEEVDSLKLKVGGIVGDKYFGRENREVLLTGLSGYEPASQNNITIEYGTLGENILCEINIKNLQLGEKFQIGDALLEVSMLCPVCTHLSSIKKELQKLIKDDRGIFLKVIQGGKITTSDKIYIQTN